MYLHAQIFFIYIEELVNLPLNYKIKYETGAVHDKIYNRLVMEEMKIKHDLIRKEIK